MRHHPLLLTLLLAGSVMADVVHLKDGSRLEGNLRRDAEGWTVSTAAGRTVFVADGDVELIQKSSPLTPAEQAENRLTALRRSVEGMSDTSQIIERYRKLIADITDTPAAAEARKELESWHERQKRGMVKVGGTWMEAADRAQLLGKAVVQIDEARRRIREGQLREADRIIGEVLAVDPSHASALYLRGLVAYRQDDIPQARKALEQCRQQLPEHGPTLNNLAVVLWRQNQHLPAVNTLDQAMQASPQDRRILDNVAEAVQALDPDEKRSQVATRAAQRFREQDTALQKQLAAEGLVRWGATYITSAQMEEVRKVREEAQKRIDEMNRDYELGRLRLVRIEQLLDRNDREMRRLLLHSRVWDPDTGVAYRGWVPGLYYDLKRDSERLRDERRLLLTSLSTYRDQARAIEQQSPLPPYSGILRVIDVEGTPAILPPTTQPGHRGS